MFSSVDAAFISSAHSTAGRISTSKGQEQSCSVNMNAGFSLPSSTTYTSGLLKMSTDDSFDDADDRDTASGRSRGTRSKYRLPSDAGPIASTCKLTEEQIHFLIAKRSECKSARNFAEADRILDGLVKAGVFLHDNRKEWRADGNNHFGRTNDHRHREYVRRGGEHGLSEEAIAEIAGVVELRAQAKRKKDFLTSDQLSEKLKTDYGVHMNDKKREWALSFVNSEEEESLTSVYVPSPIAPLDGPTHTMDEESKALIQKRLTDRLVARRSRDYALADFIRDKLQEEFAVVIDDRTREWKIATGDEDDSFVKEAQASQRSAFVRENKSVDLVEDDSSTSEVDAAFSEIFDDSPIEIDEPSFSPVVEESAQAAPQEQESESQLMTLTIPVLKEKLRDAGLPVSGKKAELVERLLETSN